MKQLWMLVGGNGAGKSTFYERFLAPKGIHFVNADTIARSLSPSHPEDRSYDAARLAESIRRQLLDEGTSFCFETVFSHASKVDFIAQAKVKGYQVVLVFIHLATIDLNQLRVAQRVADGGHGVPADKIEQRVPRTLMYVQTALALCDEVFFLDNSSSVDPFKRVARIRDGVITEQAKPVPAWSHDLLRALPGFE